MASTSDSATTSKVSIPSVRRTETAIGVPAAIRSIISLQQKYTAAATSFGQSLAAATSRRMGMFAPAAIQRSAAPKPPASSKGG